MKPSKHLYKKLIYIYSTIIIFVVLTLVLYFISGTKIRILENDKDYMLMLNEDTSNYIKKSSDTANDIIADLYRKLTELNDCMAYQEKSEEEYLRYRLDKYIASGKISYDGIDDFIQSAFEAYDIIDRITILGNKKYWTSTYYRDQKVLRKNDGAKMLKKIQYGDIDAKDELSFVKEIRDPVTWETFGYMIIIFRTDEIQRPQEYYNLPEVIVCNQNSLHIYSSEKKKYDGEVILDTSTETIEKKMGAYVEWNDVASYRVLSYINKDKAGKIPFWTLLRIWLIGLSVIAISEILIRHYLQNLANRLEYILGGMERVRTGDLTVRLNGNENGDELDIISADFNEMCQELDEYIKKSYLAEIERQKAEMEALQSQINPHFLYNTLEVIRMKAICNGDKEVSKMLYSMAVMFRSQIKDDDVIPLVQELHYCKKYLELFEYRYQSQFSSKVECPEEYMQIPIIKFVLQPILENYFIHGIRMDSDENHIYIGVKRDKDDMLIVVEDNGKGMAEEEIEAKNKELRENKSNEKKSIGISNVNRRLKAVYGAEYGLTLERSESGGIRVNVKFKSNGGDNIEKSNVSGR